MALNLGSPWLSRVSHTLPNLSKLPCSAFHNNKNALLFFLMGNNSEPSQSDTQSSYPSFNSSLSRCVKVKSLLSESGNNNSSVAEVLGDELMARISSAKDASEVLEVIAEKSKGNGGVLSTLDCCRIINAALERKNSDLALSIFNAMRSSFDQGFMENGTNVERWKWSRPDVSTSISLVLGLAASLRVSDALKVITDICRVGVSPGEEVHFGKVVRCPTCMIAVAVTQPQDGIQIVSCSRCRYQYELVSGDIVSIASEEIRISSCRTQHGYSSMEKGAEISANNEASNTCCCSFHCGPDPFRCGPYPQIRH